MESKKINFFNQIAYAIWKPKKYTDLTRVSTGRLTGFVFLFILILTFFSLCIPFIVNEITGRGLANIIENDIPDFEFTNGELELSKAINLKENNTIIVADTSVDYFSSEDISKYPSRYTSITLISKTNMINYNAGRIIPVAFSDYKNIHLTKAIINSLVPFMYAVIAFVFVIVYLIYVGIYFLASLIYALVGKLIQKKSGLDLPFGYLFRIAIYSKVTMIIVRTLFEMFEYKLPGKFIISVAVTCVYMWFAIALHKNKESGQIIQQPYQDFE